MYTDARTTPDQAKAAALALAFQALLAAGFVYGLAVRNHVTIDDTLQVLNIEPPPPPIVEPPPPREQVVPKPQAKKTEGRAAPPNLRATPTAVVLPPPVVKLPPPPTINVAPVAGKGTDASAGASDRAGPGTGAGGIGNGLGAGDDGDGDGGGGDDGDTPPRQVAGRLTVRDYPRIALERQVGGTVSVIYQVNLDGRASDCRITRSSGSRALDITTCELIEQRFRFRPGIDKDGRPFVAHLTADHEWIPPRIPVDDRPRPRGSF